MVHFVILQCCREVAEDYPDIAYEEVIIDNCCMMVSVPFQYTLGCFASFLGINGR